MCCLLCRCFPKFQIHALQTVLMGAPNRSFPLCQGQHCSAFSLLRSLQICQNHIDELLQNFEARHKLRLTHFLLMLPTLAFQVEH